MRKVSKARLLENYWWDLGGEWVPNSQRMWKGRTNRFPIQIALDLSKLSI